MHQSSTKCRRVAPNLKKKKKSSTKYYKVKMSFADVCNYIYININDKYFLKK